jgi:ADP-ribose pyrophosphatase
MVKKKIAKKKSNKDAAAKKPRLTAKDKARSADAAKQNKAARAAAVVTQSAQVLSSELVFDGPLFRVFRDEVIEPAGVRVSRDIVRHNGSVVILAVDSSKSKRDPWVVMERQYRHAAGQYLWEVPAGKIDLGEEPLVAAQRELAEETGYRARKWKPLATYYASPGFVGEAMMLYLAEDLYAGEAHPEEDEKIELRLIKLSEIRKMIAKGAIHDGKTLIAALLYGSLLGRKRKK